MHTCIHSGGDLEDPARKAEARMEEEHRKSAEKGNIDTAVEYNRTDRHTQTDRQTEIQTERPRQTATHTDKHTDRPADRQTHCASSSMLLGLVAGIIE